MLDLHGPGLNVDDHQPGRQPVEDEHDLVQPDGLTGVNLGVIGARGLVAIIAPHLFLIRRDFGKVPHPSVENVAVGEHPHIVKHS